MKKPGSSANHHRLMDNAMTSRVPILVILGSTGTGKSKLAIELAKKYFGEIISADSMQVYKGLDVITAKVTEAEQNAAPHHMLDVVDPLSTFTVVDFRNRALPIIENLLEKSKMPIIVGGTNYYIESLLWQILVEDPKESADKLVFDNEICDDLTPIKCSVKSDIDYRNIDGCSKFFKNSESYVDLSSDYKKCDKCKESDDNFNDEPFIKKFKFDDPLTNEELHRKLKDVDPEMADKLHPNNRRKIIRSLQVFDQLGTKHSDILREQRIAGGSGLGGPLRYKNSLILWLQCEKETLDERLDLRVDGMIEAGLVKELIDFHDRYNQARIKENSLPDYTKGIFQSIGFKEFHDYLILNEAERDTEKGMELLKQGIENLKLRTRQYARRQQRWVTNRFIRRFDRQVPPVYSLDCTDVTQWKRNVLEPAISIINELLEGQTPSRKSLNNNNTRDVTGEPDIGNNEQSHFCQTCERVFIGEFQWKAHLQGRKHEKMVKRKKIERQSNQQNDQSING